MLMFPFRLRTRHIDKQRLFFQVVLFLAAAAISLTSVA